MSASAPGAIPAISGVALLTAQAKLTLTFRVTGVRADGYHLVESEMVTVDLADTLVVQPGNGLTVTYDPRTYPTGHPPIASGADNLVARALATVERRADVQLFKRIPAQAGLGGGSADAAAILRWAGCADPGMAATLGADVPFCLRGGRARVWGIGERVESLPYEERRFILLCPPVGVETRAVYAAWDRLEPGRAQGTNDLEPAALAVAPELAGWRDLLGELTGREARLAGSGSTWFVEGTRAALGLEGRDQISLGGAVAPLIDVVTTAPAPLPERVAGG